MKFNRNMWMYLIFAIVGAVLLTLADLKMINEFWGFIGVVLFVAGALRLVRTIRLNRNEEYREKMEVAETDERLRFIRNKAWAWAGYLFIMCSAVAVITLKILGQDLIAMVICFAMCGMLVLYWVTFFILSRKY